MKRIILVSAIGGLLTSCTFSSVKQHVMATPHEEGCGRCHSLIYKDWKITYKPYEQVPVPGSTIAPGPFPQYHDRKGKESRPGTTVVPARRDCSGCHAGAPSPEGVCIREKSGFK